MRTLRRVSVTLRWMPAPQGIDGHGIDPGGGLEPVGQHRAGGRMAVEISRKRIVTP